MPQRSRVTVVSVLLLLPVVAAAADPVDYNRDVKPILSKNCYSCHGPDDGHRAAKLRLDQRDSAIQTRRKGAAIVPGKSAESLLVQRITSTDEDKRMPPAEAGDPLQPAQIAVLRRWIDEGATYADHWAFVKPRRSEPPTVHAQNWPRNPIDRFILARLERAGMTPSEPADKFVLFRRLSLDLRGLPPIPQEVDEFARDQRPDAYERWVDRFLADPAYGERWARMWLDLARYADSAGYGSDPLRPNIWPYRDWVIDAFNRNLPYDQFTIEQLAGDLLPNATPRQRMATAFHRNTMTNTEGGTDDEEFRVAAVKDRVDTTMQVWMGLTMGCAKCHNHKYDPIAQKEYYRFFAIFNQTADNDRPDEAPTMAASTAEQEELLKTIDSRLAELKKQLEKPSAAQLSQLAVEQAKWEADIKPSLPGTAVEPLTAAVGKGKQTLTANLAKQTLTGFRIEVVAPDQAKPAALQRLRVHVGPEDKDDRSPTGHFVRIELPGNERMLSLAEVQVFRAGVNVATKGTATQSSTAYDGPAKLAIDGNTNGDYFAAKSTTHTGTEANPWWEVKLAEAGPVDRIVVWNRTDGGVGGRLAPFRVQLLDDARKPVWQQEVKEPPAPSRELALSGRFEVAVADSYPEGAGRIFVLEKPLTPPAGTVVTLDVEAQDAAKLKVAAITDPRLTQRLMVPAAVRAVLDVPADKRTPEQREQLGAHFRTIAPALKMLRDEVARLEKSRPQSTMLPVMQELPANQRRKTRVMVKGDFLNQSDPVEPGIPAAFHALPAGTVPDRLAVARWLVSPDNPLTARVAVNRYWAQLFGKGLVETEEDFGTQGELPTHPELLDWLATEYVRLGWDTKALLKLLVTSATYHQSAKVTPEQLGQDPRNRLLGRAPRFRLEAEMVRDQALLCAGLLSRKMGGPSVYPPQPDGLWQAAFNGQRTWATSTGEDRYRRGVYTFWRRTVPYPSMATFDAPSREICAVKRVRTNTPLQALVTLNDPVYVEAAQGLARRLIKEGGATPEERVRFGLRLCLARPPRAEQVAPLIELYMAERARLSKEPTAATELATKPLGALPPGMDAVDAAAWTVVANVLLNLDGVLTKG